MENGPQGSRRMKLISDEPRSRSWRRRRQKLEHSLFQWAGSWLVSLSSFVGSTQPTLKTSVGFTGSKLDARSCCWFIHSFQDPIAAANVPLTPVATPLTTPPAATIPSTSAAAKLPAKAQPPAPSAAPAPSTAAASTSQHPPAAVPVVDLVEQDRVF